MTIHFRRVRAMSVTGIAAILIGCSGPSNAGTPLQTIPQQATSATIKHSTQAIQNVIVIVQSFRTFDNLFAGFPHAEAPTFGLGHDGQHIRLKPIKLQTVPNCDGGVDASYFDDVYDHGKMDGWAAVDPKSPNCPYTRVIEKQVDPYWQLAKSYGIADETFASTKYSMFADGLYLVAGTSLLQKNTYAVGPPTSDPWGCDAPAGTTTPILKNGKIEQGGPFPCFTQFPTIASLLDKAGVGWNSYVDPNSLPVSFDPFDAISAVREGPDWKDDTSSPPSNILNDLDAGTLRPMSFVFSPAKDSDFPGFGGGPKWVQTIVDRAKNSRYWNHLAIVVVWNDFGDGNFYDNVAPALLDQIGLGFRVPMLVVSPYVKKGYISHTHYEYASILKFIEENWNLGTLGSTDERATSIGDMFGR